eukprot:gene7719-biopygen9102
MTSIKNFPAPPVPLDTPYCTCTHATLSTAATIPGTTLSASFPETFPGSRGTVWVSRRVPGQAACARQLSHTAHSSRTGFLKTWAKSGATRTVRRQCDENVTTVCRIATGHEMPLRESGPQRIT